MLLLSTEDALKDLKTQVVFFRLNLLNLKAFLMLEEVKDQNFNTSQQKENRKENCVTNVGYFFLSLKASLFQS